MTSHRERSGFLPDRTIHLHPTLSCNLACAHCYSESGPRERAALAPADIERALRILRDEGYTHVSLSGGEPLMYPALPKVIDDAHAIGYRVTMISNGLFSPALVDSVAARLDGMAISFDGLAPIHDAIRGRAGAFDRACATLTRLAADGRPVGAAISVTRDAIPDLPDLIDHLISCGATRFQIRPVALAGRAREATGFAPLSATDQARLFLVVRALQDEFGDRILLHCDLVPARSLWKQRDDYASLLRGGEKLSMLVNPLVITSSGSLKPMTYDFDDTFDICNITDLSTDRLRDYDSASLSALVAEALSHMDGHPGFVDWFDHCARLSAVHAETLDRDRHTRPFSELARSVDLAAVRADQVLRDREA